ncbi:MAG TPA: hypothetical protein VM286_01820 [Candidatus Thermoplasmatota archaeon]|nr:hypothetical protein [Candidatus Thermoplasmatota archaeon]
MNTVQKLSIPIALLFLVTPMAVLTPAATATSPGELNCAESEDLVYMGLCTLLTAGASTPFVRDVHGESASGTRQDNGPYGAFELWLPTKAAGANVATGAPDQCGASGAVVGAAPVPPTPESSQEGCYTKVASIRILMTQAGGGARFELHQAATPGVGTVFPDGQGVSINNLYIQSDMTRSDLDNDADTDMQELFACGSNPFNAKSRCHDVDGDGLLYYTIIDEEVCDASGGTFQTNGSCKIGGVVQSYPTLCTALNNASTGALNSGRGAGSYDTEADECLVDQETDCDPTVVDTANDCDPFNWNSDGATAPTGGVKDPQADGIDPFAMDRTNDDLDQDGIRGADELGPNKYNLWCAPSGGSRPAYTRIAYGDYVAYGGRPTVTYTHSGGQLVAAGGSSTGCPRGTTLPSTLDSDNDGLPDGQEMLHRTFLTTDGSGVIHNNLIECRELTDSCNGGSGTDPNNADTDGDGFNDAQEFSRGSNPWLASDFETEGEGIHDAQEMSGANNPYCLTTTVAGKKVSHLSGTWSSPSFATMPTKDASCGADPTNGYPQGLGTFERHQMPKNAASAALNGAPTDKTKTDTDGDGLSDYEEVTGHYAARVSSGSPTCVNAAGVAYPLTHAVVSDPNNADTDGGGANDFADVCSGHNPNDPSDDDASDGLFDNGSDFPIWTNPTCDPTDSQGIIFGNGPADPTTCIGEGLAGAGGIVDGSVCNWNLQDFDVVGAGLPDQQLVAPGHAPDCITGGGTPDPNDQCPDEDGSFPTCLDPGVGPPAVESPADMQDPWDTDADGRRAESNNQADQVELHFAYVDLDEAATSSRERNHDLEGTGATVVVFSPATSFVGTPIPLARIHVGDSAATPGVTELFVAESRPQKSLSCVYLVGNDPTPRLAVNNPGAFNTGSNVGDHPCGDRFAPWPAANGPLGNVPIFAPHVNDANGDGRPESITVQVPNIDDCTSVSAGPAGPTPVPDPRTCGTSPMVIPLDGSLPVLPPGLIPGAPESCSEDQGPSPSNPCIPKGAPPVDNPMPPCEAADTSLGVYACSEEGGFFGLGIKVRLGVVTVYV